VRQEDPLDHESVQCLQVVFESASQLGVVRNLDQRPDWRSKLWAIGVHWEIDEEPWAYNEFRDRPYILDLTEVLLRLEQELKAAQEAKSFAVSNSTQPTDEHRSLSPRIDPSPIGPCLETGLGLTQARDGILTDVDDPLKENELKKEAVQKEQEAAWELLVLKAKLSKKLGLRRKS
jgi:hypothetical protein